MSELLFNTYNSLTPEQKYQLLKFGFKYSKHGYSRSMAYLRGTKAFRARRSPTLVNKVERIQRQLNRQRPEKIHWINSDSINVPSAQIKHYDVDLTRSLINSTRFRDDITGDKWYNHSCNLRLKFNSPILNLRVLVYTPKRSGIVTANLSNSSADYTSILDPTAFIVYLDRYYNASYNGVEPALNFYCNCKSMTSYNSEEDVLDRNNIRICFIWEAATAGDLYYQSHLTITNK